MKRIWISQIILIPLLLFALNPSNPYVYYTFLRWICCAVFIYLTIRSLGLGKFGWSVVLVLMAIIYNPIIKVFAFRGIWNIINLATVVIAVASIFALQYKE
ncbi:MAG: hypothetical protein OXM61_21850 [Candidatus Poribacteria bacterium]|nr:hypothetical protein [Candidatus Poribacteria bacterium]